jgi:polysaccharide export outer membrane protein
MSWSEFRTNGMRTVLLVAGLSLAFSSTTSAQQLNDYTLHAGDKLDIDVWKEPDLQKTIIVQPDGKFSFPLAGEFIATGKTVPQLKAEITARLKTYMPEPVVTVTVTEIDGNKVYVIGQVQKPGAYTMNPQVNVLQALSLAAGATPYASLNDIIVVRTTKTGQKTIPFRYGDVSKGRNLDQNILLESGDVVVVP